MPAKVLVVAQLLSCCSFAVMALSLMEGPALDIQIKAVTVFAITNIRLDITPMDATLQFCASGGLPPGIPQLHYAEPSPGSIQTTLEGNIDVNDVNCANFMMDPTFNVPDVATRYELILIDASNSAYGRCITTFAMTAKTTLLPCGPESVTKVTWGDPTPIDYNDCIDAATDLGAVCYHRGDVWTADFCFDITDEEGATITICMNGLTNTIAEGGTVSTTYFYYGGDTNPDGTATAKLSMAMGTGSSTDLRAIIRSAVDLDPTGVPGEATVHDCPSNECTFATYARVSAKYEVCVEALDDGKVTQETATITFTDMNLNAFDGGSQQSTLMKFVFANGLDAMTYSASYSLLEPAAGVLGVAEANTVKMDCSGVAPGHACFGFLDTGAASETVYLVLSGPNNVNTIVAPYVIQSPESLL